MSVETRPVLLDVTRLISRSWTRRRATGIDRVCYAYVRYYRARAHAMVQHRGIIKVLNAAASDELFDLLLAPSAGFRARFAAILARLWFQTMPDRAIAGSVYLNVSHTDFDLPAHWHWVERHGLRAVYLIHDLIPILHPEFSRPHAVKRHTDRVQMALRGADRIVVTSQTVADQIGDYAALCELPRPDCVIAPLAGEGFDDAFVPGGLGVANADQPAWGTAPPYFVSVGTIEPRKNHALLIDVWRALALRLGARAPRLVLVGQQGPLSGDILAPLDNDRTLGALIEWRKDCRDAELAHLIHGAAGVLCPSRAEGYGLPVIEGLEMDKTVLASDIAIFEEIAQGQAQLLGLDDVQAWVQAIADLIACADLPTKPDLPASPKSPGAQPPASPASPEPRPPFRAPQWADHFVRIDAVTGPRIADQSTPCVDSLAA